MHVFCTYQDMRKNISYQDITIYKNRKIFINNKIQKSKKNLKNTIDKI